MIRVGPSTSLSAVEAYGSKLAKVVALYDRAIDLLEETEKAIGKGERPRPHRRSTANLRLGRFWFEMSAFHLAALSLYCVEIRERIPEERQADLDRIYFRYVPTIRMSDCYRGYEGRTIDVAHDRELQKIREMGVAAPLGAAGASTDKTQSNILLVGESAWEYRALRHPGEILKNLDPRLCRRALRMIDAGRDVMDHEGESPWGWMVYYSEAVTFVWNERPPLLIMQTSRPGEEPPETPSTPRPQPTPGGPSTGR